MKVRSFVYIYYTCTLSTIITNHCLQSTWADPGFNKRGAYVPVVVQVVSTSSVWWIGAGVGGRGETEIIFRKKMLDVKLCILGHS